MAPKLVKVRFPIWEFLNQPIFSSTNKLILNPRLFAYLYRIQLLERCLDKKYDKV